MVLTRIWPIHIPIDSSSRTESKKVKISLWSQLGKNFLDSVRLEESIGICLDRFRFRTVFAYFAAKAHELIFAHEYQLICHLQMIEKMLSIQKGQRNQT